MKGGHGEPITLTSAIVGRVDLGAATLVVEDERLALTIATAKAPGDIVYVALDTIDQVVCDESRVSITLRDGGHLSLTARSAGSLADAILSACRAIPELTRALRAMGSRRGGDTPDRLDGDEVRYFEPLLGARRLAALAPTPAEAIRAFDPITLRATLTAAIGQFAAECAGTGEARRRAVDAELSELLEPLLIALDRAGLLGAAALARVDNLRAWRAWIEQLHAVFEAADRAWVGLRAVLVRDHRRTARS